MFFEDFYKCLAVHASKYPLMTPRDCVKLLYQSVYGCGHFVDAGKAEERLKAELHSVEKSKCDTFEDICNGRARLMLGAVNDNDVSLVSRMFAASAKEDTALGADSSQFETGLEAVYAMASEGKLRFSVLEAEEYVKVYIQAGGGAVSHSEVYRAAYAPAYRVMSPSAVRAYPLAQAISKKISEKGSAVLAIDGMCTSGKSTVAEFLSNVFDCNIIHADDFFLPPEKRTAERFAEVGGNMDRERLADVLEKAVKGNFSYRPFQCWRAAFGEERSFDAKPLLIVEGSYSLHPELREYYDVKAFSQISAEEQLLRLKKRNPELVSRFASEWIPMENRYFEEMDIKALADFVI